MLAAQCWAAFEKMRLKSGSDIGILLKEHEEQAREYLALVKLTAEQLMSGACTGDPEWRSRDADPRPGTGG